MTCACAVTSVLLMILLAALPGCGTNKEKASQAPLQKADQTQPSQKAGVVSAVHQDEAAATALKVRVLAQVKGGEFATIYKEASAGFREVGPEQQFVAMWQNQLLETGAFKGAKEISHTVRPEDNFLVFIFDVQYDKKHKALRLTFGRSKKGVLELTGINQKDLPKAGK